MSIRDGAGDRMQRGEFVDANADNHSILIIQRGDTIMAVIFRGLSPHDLSAVDFGVARPLDGNVEMTLYVLDDWHSPTSHVVGAPTPTFRRQGTCQ